MNNLSPSEILDFKSTCERLLEDHVKTSKSTSCRSICKELSTKFGIGEDAVNKRFRSYFGCTMAEKLASMRMPSREVLVREIIKAKNVTELWDSLQLNAVTKKGILDKYFGVSNFANAKIQCLNETMRVNYQPSIDENRSLVISQRLGDGSYNEIRGAFIISHGESQVDYLIYKASLFNKAFPTTKPAGNTKVLTHTQGHKYGSWYSGRLPSKLTVLLDNSSKADLVKYLSPFGIMLWFMDDGYMKFDFLSEFNTYAQLYVPDMAVMAEIQKLLESYGVKSTYSKNSKASGFSLKIGDKVSAMMFYKSFIEPFKAELPKCMHYKTDLKI